MDLKLTDGTKMDYKFAFRMLPTGKPNTIKGP